MSDPEMVRPTSPYSAMLVCRVMESQWEGVGMGGRTRDEGAPANAGAGRALRNYGTLGRAGSNLKKGCPKEHRE